MAKTAMVQAWVEPELKTEVENIFNAVGLSAESLLFLLFILCLLTHSLLS